MPFRPDRFHVPTVRSGTGGGAPAAPGVPTNFVLAARTDITIVVTWDALPVGEFVRIQSQPAGGDWSGAVENPVYSTGFTVVDCVEDTAYDIRIRAEDGAAYSDWVTLSTQYTLPAVPTGLVAAAGVYNVVNLTWDAAGIGREVNVYVDGLLHSTLAPGVTAQDYIGSTPGTSFDFQISAVSGTSGLESEKSAVVSAASGVGSAPFNTSSPSITDAGFGASVSYDGAWDADPSGPSYTYSWKLDGTEIGETGSYCSYSAGGGDVGYFSCVVTATNAVGSSSAESNSVYGAP